MKKKFHKKLLLKKEAKKSIPEFFAKAKKDPKNAKDLLRKAKNLSMKYKVKIPVELKRQRCKNCNSLLVPGITCRVRSTGHKIVYTCLSCKHIQRYPLD